MKSPHEACVHQETTMVLFEIFLIEKSTSILIEIKPLLYMWALPLLSLLIRRTKQSWPNIKMHEHPITLWKSYFRVFLRIVAHMMFYCCTWTIGHRCLCYLLANGKLVFFLALELASFPFLSSSKALWRGAKSFSWSALVCYGLGLKISFCGKMILTIQAA